MLKKLSDLSDDRLGYYLERVREISSHDDIAALIEVDKLVWEIQEEEYNDEIGEEEEDFEDEDEEQDFDSRDEESVEKNESYGENIRCENIRNLEDAINDFKLHLESEKRIKRIQISHLNFLVRMAEPRHRSWRESQEDFESREQRIQELKVEVNSLSKQGVLLCTNAELQDYMTVHLISIQTVYGVLKNLADTIERYVEAEQEITPEQNQIIEQIRLRCALSRAKKKMSSVKIAEASGKLAKAKNLRMEALALLREDWEFVFSEKNLPENLISEYLSNESALF